MKARDSILLLLALGVLAMAAYIQIEAQKRVTDPIATSSPMPTRRLTSTSTPAVPPITTVQPMPSDKETGDMGSPEQDNPSLPGSCLEEGEDDLLYVNTVDGYCLRYPARFRVGDVYPPGIANLYGPPHDESLEPEMAACTMRATRAVDGLGLADTVDRWLQQEGILSPTRREPGLLGGEPAEIVEGQAERSGIRSILTLYKGKLYYLVFYPVDERFPKAAPDVEELWEKVTSSYAFLPTE